MHIFNKQKFENEFERLTYYNEGKNVTSKFTLLPQFDLDSFQDPGNVLRLKC